jgi:hypothetical protein
VKKIPPFWLALIVGGIIEGVVCGLAAMFARFGPCGAGNDFTVVLLLIHSPGFWIADSFLPRGSWLELPVIIVVTGALWSTVAFMVIGAARSFYARAKDRAG